MFYTYVLFSYKDKKLYIGSTSDIKKRLKRHLAGEVISTKNRRPLELLFYIRSQNTVESNSTDECERIHTSEERYVFLLAHVNLKNNTEDS